MPSIPMSFKSAPPKNPNTKSGNKIKTGKKTEKTIPKKSKLFESIILKARTAKDDKRIYRFGILSVRKSIATAPDKTRISKIINLTSFTSEFIKLFVWIQTGDVSRNQKTDVVLIG